MSVLSNVDIEIAYHQGKLNVEPFQLSAIQSSSYDLVLHPNLLVLPTTFPQWTPEIDFRSGRDEVSGFYRRWEMGEAGYVLMPGQFILALTAEVVGLDNSLRARLDGRSSTGRHGLMVHATAGYLDPGWLGRVTLEISNLAPYAITLFPDLDIAQVSFDQLQTPTTIPYGQVGGSKYQRPVPVFEDDWPMPSMVHEKWAKLHPPVKSTTLGI